MPETEATNQIIWRGTWRGRPAMIKDSEGYHYLVWQPHKDCWDSRKLDVSDAVHSFLLHLLLETEG